MSDTRTDTFVRPNQVGWGTASDGHTWSNVGFPSTGSLDIVSNQGVITAAGGFAPIALMSGSLSGDDVSVLVRFKTLDRANTLSSIGVRYPNTDFLSFNEGATLNVDPSGNVSLDIKHGEDFDFHSDFWTGLLTAGDEIFVRFQAENLTYSWKVWADGDTEPVGWTGQYTTTVAPTGRNLILTENNISGSERVAYDNYTVSTLPISPPPLRVHVTVWVDDHPAARIYEELVVFMKQQIEANHIWDTADSFNVAFSAFQNKIEL